MVLATNFLVHGAEYCYIVQPLVTIHACMISFCSYSFTGEPPGKHGTTFPRPTVDYTTSTMTTPLS